MLLMFLMFWQGFFYSTANQTVKQDYFHQDYQHYWCNIYYFNIINATETKPRFHLWLDDNREKETTIPKLQVEEWIEFNCWIPIFYKELSICEKGASLAPLFTPLSTRGYNTYGGVIQTIDDKEWFCRFPFAYQKYQPWKLTLPFDPRSN